MKSSIPSTKSLLLFYSPSISRWISEIRIAEDEYQVRSNSATIDRKASGWNIEVADVD